eukprot:COSAG01_NODE_1517_length_10050_cov_2.477640_6_plen_66_part_00
MALPLSADTDSQRPSMKGIPEIYTAPLRIVTHLLWYVCIVSRTAKWSHYMFVLTIRTTLLTLPAH